MGFKSVMKKVGKVALKAAPIAAAFIPGVGPLASMAIGAGTSALSKKLEGGSLKSSLLAGAIGGGTGLLGAKVPIKGLGPASGAVQGATKNTAKSILGKVGGSALNSVMGGSGTGDLRDTLGRGLDIAKNYNDSSSQVGRNVTGSGVTQRGGGGVVARDEPTRGLGPQDVNPIDSTNYFNIGKREAIRNQPFRRGYDVITNPGEPAEGDTPEVPPTKVRMPPIYSSMGGGGGGMNRRKRQPQMAY